MSFGFWQYLEKAEGYEPDPKYLLNNAKVISDSKAEIRWEGRETDYLDNSSDIKECIDME